MEGKERQGGQKADHTGRQRPQCPDCSSNPFWVTWVVFSQGLKILAVYLQYYSRQSSKHKGRSNLWKSNTSHTFWDSFKGSNYPCQWLSMGSFPCPSWNISGGLSPRVCPSPIPICLSWMIPQKTWRQSSLISPPPWGVDPVSHPFFFSWDQVLCKPHKQSWHPVMTENSHKIMAWSLPPEYLGNSPRVGNLRRPIPRSLGFLWPRNIKEIKRQVWLDESWDNCMT